MLPIHPSIKNFTLFPSSILQAFTYSGIGDEGIEHLAGSNGDPFGHPAFVETMMASLQKFGVKTDGKLSSRVVLLATHWGHALSADCMLDSTLKLRPVMLLATRLIACMYACT